MSQIHTTDIEFFDRYTVARNLAMSGPVHSVPPEDEGGNVRQEDAIVAAVAQYIDAERRRNFYFLGQLNHTYMNGESMSVKFTRSISTAENISILEPRAGWYQFTPRQGAEYTILLRLSSGHEHAAGENIKIEHLEMYQENGSGWIQLTSWLLSKFDWSISDPEDLAYEVAHFLTTTMQENMEIWWKHNGKHFKILALPAELRNEIYSHAIGTIAILRTKSDGQISLGWGTDPIGKEERVFIRHPEDDPPVQRLNTNLYRVNKQVSEEAKAIAWETTMKRFGWTSPYYTPLSARIISSLEHSRSLLALSKIQLELSAAQYFAFLGIIPTSQDPFGTGQLTMHISTLRRIKTIKHLDLRFISPKRPDAEDPWANLPHLWGPFGRPRGRIHSCQKIWIEWFLTLFQRELQSLNNIKKVTLSGCVKHSTREAWEPLLAKMIKTGITDPNLGDKITWIKHQNRRCEPIPCRCTNKCVSLSLQQQAILPPWVRYPKTEVEKFDYND